MRECPWCGRKNLNVYAYCQGCGRGFSRPPEAKRERAPARTRAKTGVAVSAAALLIGGLGLMFGLPAFSGDDADAIEEPETFDGTIVGENDLFAPDRIALPPGTEVTLRMDNRDDGIFHNFVLFDSERAGEGSVLGGCLAGCETDEIRTPLEPGPVVQEFTFVTPGPGLYGFWCDVHPLTQIGVLEVRDDAPLPGEEPGERFDGTIVAEDDAFSPDQIALPPDTEITLQVDNRDVDIFHNFVLYESEEPGVGSVLTGCTAGCETGEVRTAVEPGPIVQELTFITPGPGRYGFWCELHPATQLGVIEVRDDASPPQR